MFENLFKDLKRHEAMACVIASSRGTPVAWFGLDKKSVDIFSSLSAAMFGAAKVLHKEAEIGSPELVLSQAEGSFIIFRGINDRLVLVVIGRGDENTLSDGIEKALKDFRGVVI